MFKRRNHNRSTGQALVEFAIMAVVLLMIIFLVIEAARILWAWGTVQNAAREGARYAITGESDRPECAVESLVKFNDQCDDTGNLRVSSVISRSHTGLAGLPLNETSGVFEDDNYYNIEVWGADVTGQIRGNFAGVPNAPVIVRVYYRVPIITPFFSPILPSIPVFGQAIMYNESFGQLGSGSGEGAALPPPIGEIPTVGVTPSPTNTPTPDNSTFTPVPTDTPTPTATANFCRVKFDRAAVADSTTVYVTGEIGTLVRIVNLTTGGEIISSNFTMAGPYDGHVCPGLAEVSLTGPLVNGHSIAVESSDGSVDITFVLPGTPTPTATNTSTATATPDATDPPAPITPTPSITPRSAYIVAVPDCGAPDTNGNVPIQIFGYNWPDEEVIFYWEVAGAFRFRIDQGHGGAFSASWQEPLTVPDDPTVPDIYNILAFSNSNQTSAQYQIPCDNATPVPTVTATPTATPMPADLIIVGPPELVTEGVIIGYEPVAFSVVISNTGEVDVNNQFFVDLYLDPEEPIGSFDVNIPLDQSSGYAGISSLSGNTSRVITITAPYGFENEPNIHAVYGMVDSVEQIQESIETNNISAMATADYVIPGATPTPSPTPATDGTNTITGRVNWISPDGLDPLHRAIVRIYNSSGALVNFTQSSANGVYEFTNLPGPETYTITACGNLDGDRYGLRSDITVPNSLPVVSIFTSLSPCP